MEQKLLEIDAKLKVVKRMCE